jgi:hypothetical protein
MKLPYVIDNQTHVLAGILKGLLSEHTGRSLDVAAAYFTVGGFGLIQEGLATLGNFRLLRGAEPTTGEQLGLRPDATVLRGLVRRDLEQLPFDEKTLRLVEEDFPMTEHDIPFSAIVTPNEIIEPKTPFARPKGIHWQMMK